MARTHVARMVMILIVTLVVSCDKGGARETDSRSDRSAEDSRVAAALDAVTVTPAPVATQVVAQPVATDVPLPTSTPWPTPTFPPTSTPDPFAAAGVPVRMAIPAIAVDADVERVGLTAERAMDVPRGWQNVGWYQLGFYPGEVGNAVVAGHLDTNAGGPAVFWSLDKLQPGDEVTIVYGNGDQYTFAVESSEVYRQNTEGPIIERIFGSSLTSDLNLITCDGAWDHGQATYTHRLVVFTTLVTEKTVRSNGSASAYD